MRACVCVCVCACVCVDGKIVSGWSAEETRALVCIGAKQNAIQPSTQYCALSQVQDIYLIFVDGAKNLVHIKMSVWMRSMHFEPVSY